DLGPVLLGPVEVGGDRAGADVGVLAEVGVAQVGDVRHARVAANPSSDELGEAADVDVGGDLCPGPQLGEGAAVGPVPDARVLYMDVRADPAFGADRALALDDREGLDDRVLSDGHGGVDVGGRR